MRNDFLNIHDEDLSSNGGPPGWLAFGVVMTSYFFVVLGVLMYCTLWR